MSDARPFARSVDDLRDLHVMCRRGRVYDVERWIAEGKPLQLAPGSITKGKRPATALEIAIESGQHSLTLLLLRSGYRQDLERYPPLDQSPLELALESRRSRGPAGLGREYWGSAPVINAPRDSTSNRYLRGFARGPRAASCICGDCSWRGGQEPQREHSGIGLLPGILTQPSQITGAGQPRCASADPRALIG